MRLLPVPLLALALVLGACGSSSDSGGSSGAMNSAAGAAAAPVASAKKDKVGEVVVDAEGRTLYRFTAEAQGRPVCTAECAKTWLPATVTAATGLPDHVATVKRPDDGALQLTYDGHPLYRFSGDGSKADAKGEGVGGQWFTVKAAGAASGGQATTESKRSYGY